MNADGPLSGQGQFHCADALGSGPTFERYRILELLGRGGFAWVYLARRLDTDVDVAIKVPMSTLAARTAFEHECRVVRRIPKHEHVVAFEHELARGHDSNGNPVEGLVMELIRGALPISRFCEKHRLGPRARFRLLRQAALGIAHLHESRYVHGDLKPGNILVDQNGCVKVTDFSGVTELNAPPPDVNVSTKSHRADEQANPEPGERIGPEADLNAFGLVLRECVGTCAVGDSKARAPAGDPRRSVPDSMLGAMIARMTHPSRLKRTLPMRSVASRLRLLSFLPWLPRPVVIALIVVAAVLGPLLALVLTQGVAIATSGSGLVYGGRSVPPFTHTRLCPIDGPSDVTTATKIAFGTDIGELTGNDVGRLIAAIIDKAGEARAAVVVVDVEIPGRDDLEECIAAIAQASAAWAPTMRTVFIVGPSWTTKPTPEELAPSLSAFGRFGAYWLDPRSELGMLLVPLAVQPPESQVAVHLALAAVEAYLDVGVRLEPNGLPFLDGSLVLVPPATTNAVATPRTIEIDWMDRYSRVGGAIDMGQSTGPDSTVAVIALDPRDIAAHGDAVKTNATDFLSMSRTDRIETVRDSILVVSWHRNAPNDDTASFAGSKPVPNSYAHAAAIEVLLAGVSRTGMTRWIAWALAAAALIGVLAAMLAVRSDGGSRASSLRSAVLVLAACIAFVCIDSVGTGGVTFVSMWAGLTVAATCAVAVGLTWARRHIERRMGTVAIT